MEVEVWTSYQGDRVHQEETAAGVWWQAGGGAAEQTAAGEEGQWTQHRHVALKLAFDPKSVIWPLWATCVVMNMVQSESLLILAPLEELKLIQFLSVVRC